jgi:hypothetical protein
MKKLTTLIFVALVCTLFTGCSDEQGVLIEALCQNEKPDGFIDNWSAIIPIDPPPPAPFRFLHGDPIDLNQVSPTSIGRESRVIVRFTVSMSTVGEIGFQAGSAPGVMAATRQIEEAMNSWHFENNGWGPIDMTLNYGAKTVEFDFAKFNLLERVELNKASFRSAFLGRKGDIKFPGY